MKKRVLSFLVACLMVVSTFIISKPLVNVHAVESETTYVEGENQWTLPMDWTTGLKSQNPSADLYTYDMGFNYAEMADKPWKFAFYTDVDAGTAYVAESTVAADTITTSPAVSGKGKGPAPFIETLNNRWIFVGTTNYTNWYVCSTGRWQDPSIAKGDNSTYMKFTHYNKTYTPAVVFIAPEDGTYSFSELVTGVTFTGTNGDDATLTATVRKNGTVIAAFSPTTDNASKTLTGEVSLLAGEELAFVFSQDVNNFVAYGAADKTPVQFNLGTTVVKKVGEYPENYVAKVDLTPKFEVGSYTDKLGNVTLMGCNITTRELYPIESYVTETTNNSWLALDPLGKHGTNYSLYGNNKGYNLLWGIDKTTGLIMAVGGSQLTTNTGSALVFEAPYDGIFSFDVMMTSCYPYAKNNSTGVENFRYHDFTIAKEDGTILVTKHNEGATAKHASVTITAVAELKAGEKVIVTKTPHANGSTQINASCNGNASVAIYEVEHICSADTVNPVDANDANCVEGGNVAYYACSCGTNFADADATEVIADVNTPVDEDAHAPATEWTTDEVGHWYVCNNGCGEKLSYAEHDWTNGACGTCGLACPAHDMKNAEGKCATCGMTHEHAWMDGVCETCGYECQHTGGTATCATRAMCEVCDSYYGDTVADNHEREGQWVDDVDGCYLYYGCCYTSEPVQDHVYDDDADMTCKNCGHDRTVAVKEEDFAGVFEDVFGEGESDVVAEAPEENAFDNYAAVAGSKADVYLGFNLELVGADADYVYLRHHILYNGGEVLVDGNEVTLNKVSGNYYYFDVAVAIGDFDKAHVVTIDGDTIVTASVYSYMKTAYGSGTLTAEQTNLLNALYQWDKAVADATYNG